VGPAGRRLLREVGATPLEIVMFMRYISGYDQKVRFSVSGMSRGLNREQPFGSETLPDVCETRRCTAGSVSLRVAGQSGSENTRARQRGVRRSPSFSRA